MSRQRWPFAFALWDVAFDPLRNPQTFDRFYREKSDPWNYAGDPAERERHRLAAELLDVARNAARFTSALEIGCSEGAFTELLAARSKSLLAVDFSPIALERARRRCRWAPEVRFERYDLRRDPAPGSFELAVVMDVLTSFSRPGVLRAARDKLAGCVRTEGWLLVSDHRQHPLFETRWWGKRMLRGGKWIVSSFAEHPALDQIAGRATDTHVLALFRKRAGAL